jgi:hypothetical protein
MTDLSGKDFGTKIQCETSMTLGTAMLAVAVILVFAVVQSIRFGLGAADYIMLIVGSILSVNTEHGCGVGVWNDQCDTRLLLA